MDNLKRMLEVKVEDLEVRIQAAINENCDFTQVLIDLNHDYKLTLKELS